jgi:uncharacterized protein YjbI with pentapeptide repeats
MTVPSPSPEVSTRDVGVTQRTAKSAKQFGPLVVPAVFCGVIERINDVQQYIQAHGWVALALPAIIAGSVYALARKRLAVFLACMCLMYFSIYGTWSMARSIIVAPGPEASVSDLLRAIRGSQSGSDTRVRLIRGLKTTLDGAKQSHSVYSSDIVSTLSWVVRTESESDSKTESRCDLAQVSQPATSTVGLAIEILASTPKSLEKANLSNSNLAGVTFPDGAWEGTSFSGAQLCGAVFGSNDLSGADFSNANLEGAFLQNVPGLNEADILPARNLRNACLPVSLRGLDSISTRVSSSTITQNPHSLKGNAQCPVVQLQSINDLVARLWATSADSSDRDQLEVFNELTNRLLAGLPKSPQDDYTIPKQSAKSVRESTVSGLVNGIRQALVLDSGTIDCSLGSGHKAPRPLNQSLTILGKRDSGDSPPDLSNLDLSYASFVNGNWEDVRFDGSVVCRTLWGQSRVDRASFPGAQLDNSYMDEVRGLTETSILQARSLFGTCLPAHLTQVATIRERVKRDSGFDPKC